MLGWSLFSPFDRVGARYIPDSSWNPVWETEYDTENNEIPEPGADTGNSDSDTLPNWLETYYGTDRYDPDTDDDGATDNEEVFEMGTSPTNPDSNGNGINDRDEWIAAHSAPVIGTPSVLAATVGTGFSQELSAWGGSGAYAWSIGGAAQPLPDGFTITPTSTGLAITGTASSAWTWTFTLQVTDGEQRVGTKDITLAASYPVPVITSPAVLPVFTTTVFNDLLLTAANGTPAYSWAVVDGALPDGLSLSADGHLAGCPSLAGTWTFAVQVTDAAFQTAVKCLAVTTVDLPALEITTSSLAAMEAGTPFASSLAAAGGAPPYVWSISNSSLPNGVVFSPDGHIAGTAPSAGNWPFSVQVTDNAGHAAAKDFIFTAFEVSALEIITSYLGAVERGMAYDAWVVAAGGYPDYSWSIINGGLPDGVTLSPNGHLTGTALVAGGWNLTLQVTDSQSQTRSKDLLFSVVEPPPPLSITTGSSLPDGVVSGYYDLGLVTVGGTAPLSWSIASGALPSGMSLTAEGHVSGNPNAEVTAYFTVQVTDGAGQYATQSFVLTIAPDTGGGGSNPEPDSDGDGLTDSAEAVAGTNPGDVDTDDDFLTDNEEVVVFASSGFNPLNRSTTGNGVPDYYVAAQAGLLADTDGGGIPDRLEDYWSPLDKNSAADDAGDIDSDGFTNVQEYNAGYDVWNGFAPQFDNDGDGMTNIWEMNHGTNPNAADGDADPDGDWWMNIEEYRANTDPQVAGTPPADDLSLLDHSANDWDGDGRTNAYEVYYAGGAQWSSLNPRFKEGTVVVPPWEPGALTITTTLLPSGLVNAPYAAGLGVSGGSGGGYAWNVAGMVPPGIGFSGGTFYGTATGSGSFTCDIQLTDSAGTSVSRSFTIVIREPTQPLAIVTPNLPNAQVGTGYSASLSVSGGTPPYSWSITGGGIPSGITLSSSGSFSGSPLTSGSSSFTIQVTDGDMNTATASASLAVQTETPPAPLVITTDSLPWGDVDVPYSAALTASGGTGGYQWLRAGGSLPRGITLTTDGGLTGTPVESGSFHLTFGVSDSSGATGQTSLTLNVGDVVLLNGRTNSLGGGYVPETPGHGEYTETTQVWEIDGLPIPGTEDDELELYTSYISQNGDLMKYEVNKFERNPEDETLWDWILQKWVYVTRTVLIPELPTRPASASDYVVVNETFTGGMAVLETAQQIMDPAKVDKRYAGNVYDVLNFQDNTITEAGRREREMDTREMETTTSAQMNAYPKASWRQYWLKSAKVAYHDTTRTWLARSWTQGTDSAESDVRLGLVTLTLSKDHYVSTSSSVQHLDAAKPVVGLTQSNGVVTCAPPFDSADGVTNHLSLLPVEVMGPDETSPGRGWESVDGTDPLPLGDSNAPPSGSTPPTTTPIGPDPTGNVKSLTEFKIAKMTNTVDGDNKLQIGRDPDRFLLRIQGLTNVGNVRIKIATEGASVNEHDDDATELRLTGDFSGNFVTDWQVLVSNKALAPSAVESGGHPVPPAPADATSDDDYTGDYKIGPDDQPPAETESGWINDCTHVAELGSKVVLKGLKIGDQPWQSVNAVLLKPIAVKKEIPVRFAVMSDTNTPDIQGDLMRANERWAQVGIKFRYQGPTLTINPQDVSVPTSNGGHRTLSFSTIAAVDDNGNGGLRMGVEAIAIVDTYNAMAASPVGPNDILMIYCKNVFTPGLDVSRGQDVSALATFPSWVAKPSNGGPNRFRGAGSNPQFPAYANKVFMSQLLHKPHTVPHELGHLLLDQGHFNEDYEPDPRPSDAEMNRLESHNLMRKGTSYHDGVGETKRIYEPQEDMLKATGALP